MIPVKHFLSCCVVYLLAVYFRHTLKQEVSMKSKKVIHLYYENEQEAELVDRIDQISEEMEQEEGEKVDFKKAAKRLINKGIKAYEGEK